MACPSAQLCVAVDDAGNTLASTDPMGSAAWTVSHVADLRSVTCATQDLCVAVGDHLVATSSSPAAGVWQVAKSVDITKPATCDKPGTSGDCHAALVDATCATSSLCLGIDDQGGGIRSTTPANAGSWTGGGAPGPVKATSCVNGSLCVGICDAGAGPSGANCRGPHYENGEIATWNPLGDGKPLALTTVSKQPLVSLSCKSSGICITADAQGNIYTANALLPNVVWTLVHGPFGTATPALSAAHARVLRAMSTSRARMRRIIVAHRGRPALVARQVVQDSRSILGMKAFRRRFPNRLGATAAVRRSPKRLAARAATTASSTPTAQYGMSGIGLVGFGSSPGQYAYCTVSQIPCPTGDLMGFYQTSGSGTLNFNTLRINRLQTARFFIPYDALESYSPSTGACIASQAYLQGHGPAEFDQLVYNLQAAQADGLSPVVAFTTGNGNFTPAGSTTPIENFDPVTPELTYATSAYAAFQGFTVADHDYSCGIQQIMKLVGQSGIGSDPVSNWEAWNEPNGSTQNNSFGGGYNGTLGPCTTPDCKGSASNPGNPGGGYPSGACGSGSYTTYAGETVINACGGEVHSGALCGDSTFQYCGPLEAANLWQVARMSADIYNRSWRIAAETMSDADNYDWQSSYELEMSDFSACPQYSWCTNVLPTTWSTHDYGDPSGAIPGHQDLDSWYNGMAYGNGFSPTLIWVTESAADLNYTSLGDDNRSTGCNDGEADHYNAALAKWDLGGCVDHSPSAQTTATQTFLGLGIPDSANPNNPINQVDWYEFQAPNASSGFDSGMLSPPAGTYAVPSGGNYGGNTTTLGRRQSFCVLANLSTSSCSSSTVDASDWSTNQDH